MLTAQVRSVDRVDQVDQVDRVDRFLFRFVLFRIDLFPICPFISSFFQFILFRIVRFQFLFLLRFFRFVLFKFLISAIVPFKICPSSAVSF